MSIADWSKPLGGFTVSRMSRAGGHDVAVAISDCGISTTSQTRPVCKHCLSALPIDKSCQWKHKLDYYGVFFAHLATGCGIKAKDPLGWIQIGESSTRGVVRIPLGLKPSRDSRATSQRDSPIRIQPLGVFRYNIPSPASEQLTHWS